MRISLLAIRAALALGCLASVQGTTHGQTYPWTSDGAGTGDFFGFAVGGGGDIDGDGVGDIVAGAIEPHPLALGAGYVRAISGSNGSTLFTWFGDALGDAFGRAVCIPGDLDGDGRADVVVGAPADDNNGSASGMIRVFTGSTGAVLYQIEGDGAGDQLGTALSAAGDCDGDGFADFIAGAPQTVTGRGRAFIFSGLDGTPLAKLSGSAVGDRFGCSVSTAGDVNQDGAPDFIVGAMGDDTAGTNAGSARVISGADGATLYVLTGAAPNNEFGNSVADAGDVNGDGFDDLVIGEWKADPLVTGLFLGAARVVSGANGLPLYQFPGVSGDDQLGSAVGGAGDVNGDGYGDFMFSARHDTSLGHTGAVYVHSGADGSLVYTLFGDQVEDHFGSALARAGDLDGDGLSDLVVGAAESDHANPEEGYVRAFLGCRGKIVAYGEACSGSAAFAPKLYVSGCPAPGATIKFEITRAVGGGTATLYFGRTRDSVPQPNGCTLLLGQLLGSTMTIQLAGSGPGTGTGSKTRLLPPNLAPGSRFTIQAFIPDPGVPGGMSATNAIEIRLP